MAPDDPLERRLQDLPIATPVGLAERVRSGARALPPRRHRRVATFAAVLATGLLAVAFGAVALRGAQGVTPPAGRAIQASEPSPTAPVLIGEFIPWLPLPESAPLPSPPPTVDSPPAGVSPCRASNLEVRRGRSSGLTGGQVARSIVLRSTASAPCYLQGRPVIGAVYRGRGVPAEVSDSGFFKDEPVHVVLLQPGTAAFPPITDQPELISAQPGWAGIVYQWAHCQGMTGTTVVFELPSGGGRVSVQQDPSSPPALCSDQPAGSFLAVGPVLGFAPPTVAATPAIQASLRAQAAVRAGRTLTYFVTLTNVSDADISLLPCGNYTEFIGQKLAAEVHQLNCSPAPSLGAHASRTFEMRLEIPASTPAGDVGLTWASTYGGGATAQVAIHIAR